MVNMFLLLAFAEFPVHAISPDFHLQKRFFQSSAKHLDPGYYHVYQQEWFDGAVVYIIVPYE